MRIKSGNPQQVLQGKTTDIIKVSRVTKAPHVTKGSIAPSSNVAMPVVQRANPETSDEEEEAGPATQAPIATAAVAGKEEEGCPDCSAWDWDSGWQDASTQ